MGKMMLINTLQHLIHKTATVISAVRCIRYVRYGGHDGYGTIGSVGVEMLGKSIDMKATDFEDDV